MNQYVFHTPETAPESARPILAAAQQKLGFVPALYAGLANAPAALEAYIALSGYFDNTSLSPIERQVVLLATSVENGCEFCVAAHSLIAKKMAGVPEQVVDALRAGKLPADARLAALTAFTRAVVQERGWVAEHTAFKQFLEAGYSRAQALEVILGVTQKTLSNYANHLLQTSLDPAFESERWSRK
ncbi:MAG: carboxymuconolactone decarboxylase family protein [Burkholderiales bacterium]|nr:carboxymuconolactone decarboxylase family protein [Burkholderiales bacterium]